MSGARGKANHYLHLARILLDAWQREIAIEETPRLALAEAFYGPLRERLLDAYGWFLLALSQPDSLPDHPPHCCAELPAPAEGRAVPAEVLEFARLELDGWLKDLLVAPTTGSTGGLPSSNLAASGSPAADPQQVEHWLRALAGLFERMGDSLDEC